MNLNQINTILLGLLPTVLFNIICNYVLPIENEFVGKGTYIFVSALILGLGTFFIIKQKIIAHKWIITIFILLLGVNVFYNASTTNKRIKNALIVRGTGTKAIVTKKQKAGKNSTSYYLDYTFKIAGQEWKNSESVYPIIYDKLKEGDTIPVIYLDKNPSISRVDYDFAKSK